MRFPGSNPKPAPLTGFESYMFLNMTQPESLQTAEQAGSNNLANTTLHELGHGLGLGHPHDGGNGTVAVGSAASDDPSDTVLDNERYTVMSYEAGGLDVALNRGFGHAAIPSALDIAALQAMYGGEFQSQ